MKVADPTRRTPSRNLAGHFHSSKAARAKVLHRCSACGMDLLLKAVWLAKTEPMAGDLVHRRNGRRCGPVMFQALRVLVCVLLLSGCVEERRAAALMHPTAYECCDEGCSFSSSIGCPVGPMAPSKRRAL